MQQPWEAPLRKIVSYPGKRIGPGQSEFVCNENLFFEGWDKYATEMGGCTDPASIFMIHIWHRGYFSDTSLGFNLHTKVMLEELLGERIDAFMDKMKEWVPSSTPTEEVEIQTRPLTEVRDVTEHAGASPAREGDSIDDGELIWVYQKDGWVPYWSDKRRERSGP
jgi:hypothetical protein